MEHIGQHPGEEVIKVWGRESDQVMKNELKSIFEEHESLKDARFEVLDNVGIKVKIGEEPVEEPVKVCIDFDDVIAKTTELKKTRLEKFQAYMASLFGTYIADETFLAKICEGVMNMADKNFSRYAVYTGGGKTYHVDSHLLGIQYIVSKLLELTKDGAVDKDQEFKKSEFEQQVKSAETFFTSAIGSLKKGEGFPENLPFYFDNEKGRLVMKGLSNIWSSRLYDIFKETTIYGKKREYEGKEVYGEYYEDIVEIIKNLQVPVTIFTFGSALYQLDRVGMFLDYLISRGITNVREIWLTEIDKGSFSEVVEKQDIARESQIKRIVIIDDNPDDLSSFTYNYQRTDYKESGEYSGDYRNGFTENTKDNTSIFKDLFDPKNILKYETIKDYPDVYKIRIRRSGIKTEYKNNKSTVDMDIDFRTENRTPQELSNEIKKIAGLLGDQ